MLSLQHVEVVDAFDVDRLTKVVKEEVARDEVSANVSHSFLMFSCQGLSRTEIHNLSPNLPAPVSL